MIRYFLLGLTGMAAGSFAQCAAYRFAHPEVNARRSVCDHCGHALKPFDLIPVLGYILRQGRCAYCGKKIPARYPLTEVFCAFLYIEAGRKIPDAGYLSFACGMVFWAVFLAEADRLTMCVPGAALGLLGLCAAVIRLFYAENTGNLLGDFAPGIAMISFTVFAEKILKKEWMGAGDGFFVVAAGVVLGAYHTVWVVMAASFAGLCRFAFGKEERIPFLPDLVRAFLLVWLWIL